MVSETPVLSSERFLPDCQEVLDKTVLHVVFRFYVEVFKDMNIQIVSAEGSI